MNKVILIGYVGRDPDVRYIDQGRGVANFPLATSERGYTLANGTVVPERTEWHNIVVWGNQVPFVERYVKKGSGVYVEGKLRTRSYDDSSGAKRYVTEIYAERVEFFNIGSGQSQNTQADRQQPSQPAAATVYAQPRASQTPDLGKLEEADDLPF